MSKYTYQSQLKLEQEIQKLKSELEQWKIYAKRYEEWVWNYKDKMHTFEAGMSKPNKPGYFRANND